MSLESELRARLDSFVPLTALVGTRIYKGELPSDTLYPAVAFNRITTQTVRAFGMATGDIRARVQIDVSAPRDREADVEAAKAQVRLALQDWKGGNVKDITVEDERNGYSANSLLHVVSFDVLIWFKE